MPSFRIMFLWLVMALVPLQGFAAAAKFCCATRSDEQGRSHPGASSSASHSVALNVFAVDAQLAEPGPRLAVVGGAVHEDVESCRLCASLCHAVAIAPTLGPLPAPGPTSAEIAYTAIGLPSVPSPVAERPPRG